MRIFVSSTFKDLQPERQAAIEVLRQAELLPWGMELFVSSPSKPIDETLREVQMSDAVILIIGFKAGSLIPDSPDLTFTAAEFHRARELDRPIFVFFRTEAGQWVNKEPEGSLRNALDEFKKAVDSANLLPSYFDNPDQLKTEILLALKRWDDKGRPGARLVFTSPKEFFAPYVTAAPRLFDFEQTLRGRAAELGALNAFLADGESIVGVLPGRGGIGKSKLLHDWTRDVTGATVLYVRDNAVWHGEAAKEIPVGNVVIVADDAHRLTFLDELLTLVRTLRQRQKIKILLGTRPSGTNQIDASLSTRFDSSQIIRFAPLQQIARQSVIELGQEVLGPTHGQYAPGLASVSADTPLVTVVGGRLIARGDITPALLANQADFRHTVFDRFSAEYERLLPAGPVNWRSLLNLIAALGPLDPNADKFLTPAAEILHVRIDEVRSAVDRLEQSGLLLRGGRLVRIVPDLLSDFLLEGACVTRNGESTTFADLVFEKFRETYLSNILRNLGELDWRMMHIDQGVRLLDRTWDEIRETFRAADASGRVDLLKSLHEAAIFQPGPVSELVRLAMETEATPTKVLETWTITQSNVLRELPDLLRPIAHHMQYFDDATRTLWTLHQITSRDQPTRPRDAWHALEELAEYRRYKPAALNCRMADLILDFARLPGAFDGPHTPLDLADKLLVKEGQFTEGDGFSFSFGGFPLNYNAVNPSRERALELVETTLNSDNPRVALRAIRSISHVLSGFLPLVGRQVGSEELAWQDAERERVLTMLGKRLQKLPIAAPVVRKIRSVLLEIRRRSTNVALVDRVDTVLGAALQTDEVLIFEGFCSGQFDHDGRFETLEEAEQDRREMVTRAVAAFRKKHASPRQQVDALAQLVAGAEFAGVDLSQKCTDFIEQLSSDRGFLTEFIHYVLDDRNYFLGYMICIPLASLRTIDRARYRELGLKGANHKTTSVGLGTASAVRYCLFQTDPIAEDLAILEALSKHKDWTVRHATLRAIGRLGVHESFKRDAIALLIGTGIEEIPALAEEMCEAVAPGRIDFADLLEADVRAVLHKLIPVSEIDEYHTNLFLDRVGRAYPTALFDFLIRRLDRGAALLTRDGSMNGYVPVPRGRFGAAFKSLSADAGASAFLSEIRDRFVSQPDQRYWLRELFWDIGTVDATALSAIDELLHSGNSEKMRSALELTSGAPSELALTRPYFAVHLLELCEQIDHTLAEQASSVLIGNAHTGSFQRTPGSPSPKYQRLEQRAATLRDQFIPGSIGHRLFSKLHASAAGGLERERLDDDQLRFQNPAWRD